MQITTHPAPERGQQFTLTAETDADRELIDAIDLDGPQSLVRQITQRSPNPSGAGYINTGITLLADRKHPQALEIQTGRQLLRATRELLRLGLGEDALHSHIGLNAANPDTQDKLSTLLQKLHVMLDAGVRAIGQGEGFRQKIDTTHCSLLCSGKHHDTLPAIGTRPTGAGGTLGAIVARPDGRLYGLIVSDAEHEITGAWGEYGQDVPGTNNTDGLASTKAMATAGSAIAKAVRALSIDGHTDWFIPTQLDLLSLHVHAPKGLFTPNYYWSSSQSSRYDAWCQDFEYGDSPASLKGSEFRARPVRSIQLQPFTPSSLPQPIAEGDPREIAGQVQAAAAEGAPA